MSAGLGGDDHGDLVKGTTHANHIDFVFVSIAKVNSLFHTIGSEGVAFTSSFIVGGVEGDIVKGGKTLRVDTRETRAPVVAILVLARGGGTLVARSVVVEAASLLLLAKVVVNTVGGGEGV